MSLAKKQYKRITTKSLVEMKMNGEKISMPTIILWLGLLMVLALT